MGHSNPVKIHDLCMFLTDHRSGLSHVDMHSQYSSNMLLLISTFLLISVYVNAEMSRLLFCCNVLVIIFHILTFPALVRHVVVKCFCVLDWVWGLLGVILDGWKKWGGVCGAKIIISCDPNVTKWVFQASILGQECSLSCQTNAFTQDDYSFLFINSTFYFHFWKLQLILECTKYETTGPWT